MDRFRTRSRTRAARRERERTATARSLAWRLMIEQTLADNEPTLLERIIARIRRWIGRDG